MYPIILSLMSLISISAFAQVGPGNSNTTDYRGSYCQVEMQTARGGVIQSFEEDNCRRALRRCDRALAERQRRGLNPYASCKIVNQGGGYNPPPYNPPPRNPPPYNPPPRNPPPYNPPGRGGGSSWACVANDSGTEEHYGGHTGYGSTQYEAADNAVRICKLSHGQCYIARCSAQ